MGINLIKLEHGTPCSGVVFFVFYVISVDDIPHLLLSGWHAVSCVGGAQRDAAPWVVLAGRLFIPAGCTSHPHPPRPRQQQSHTGQCSPSPLTTSQHTVHWCSTVIKMLDMFISDCNVVDHRNHGNALLEMRKKAIQSRCTDTDGWLFLRMDDNWWWLVLS